MKDDVLRAIGHLNLVLDEYSAKMWPEEQESIRRAIIVLQGLAKKG